MEFLPETALYGSGVLSRTFNQCAIVGMEYEVPAVGDPRGITGKIRDGDRLRPNGEAETLEMPG